MSGSGLEILLDVREWLGGPPKCLVVLGKPSRMSENGQDALQDVKE